MRKGFTTVELLSVTVVLGIILSIAIIRIRSISEERNQTDYNNIASMIEENTKVLVNTDSEISSDVDETLQDLKLQKQTDDSIVVACQISYQELVDKKLMDKNTVNPKTGRVIDSLSYIKITLDSDDTYKYEFIYVKDSNGVEYPENCLN